MAAAGDVERPGAVAIVVAVEEAPLLIAMQRIVSGVEIKDDLRRRTSVRLQKYIDEQRLDRRRVVAHLMVPRRFRPAQFEAVQRRLASERRAARPLRRELASQNR